ncbi:MAG: insulinase family protein [Geminicoccaceae bacterium]
MSAWRWKGCPTTMQATTRSRCSRPPWAAACPRLFQEARGGQGLCYSVFSFASAYADTGTLGVYAGTDPEGSGRLLQVMAEETRALIEEARRGRACPCPRPAQGQPVHGPGELLGRVEGNARQLLCFGRRVPAREIVEQIDAVDAATNPPRRCRPPARWRLTWRRSDPWTPCRRSTHRPLRLSQ